jgi:hypothetical protein
VSLEVGQEARNGDGKRRRVVVIGETSKGSSGSVEVGEIRCEIWLGGRQQGPHDCSGEASAGNHHQSPSAALQ